METALCLYILSEVKRRVTLSIEGLCLRAIAFEDQIRQNCGIEDIVGSIFLQNIPQGLKPIGLLGLIFGTTEVEP
jgi:hypothetical protein